MHKSYNRPADPQPAPTYCFCSRCAREVYSPADGVHLGRHMLCTDCLRALRREVKR